MARLPCFEVMGSPPVALFSVWESDLGTRLHSIPLRTMSWDRGRWCRTAARDAFSPPDAEFAGQ